MNARILSRTHCDLGRFGRDFFSDTYSSSFSTASNNKSLRDPGPHPEGGLENPSLAVWDHTPRAVKTKFATLSGAGRSGRQTGGHAAMGHTQGQFTVNLKVLDGGMVCSQIWAFVAVLAVHGSGRAGQEP